jgi:hypothetical protein
VLADIDRYTSKHFEIAAGSTGDLKFTGTLDLDNSAARSAVGDSTFQQIDHHFRPRSTYLRPELEAGWHQLAQIETRVRGALPTGVGITIGELARCALDSNPITGYELLIAGPPLGSLVDCALQPLGGTEAMHPAQRVVFVASR